MSFSKDIAATQDLIKSYNGTWDGISAEAVARMKAMNKFKTGLDIAQYTANIMRRDMAAYDKDPANYTQSLGCWHGFIGPAEDDFDQEAFRHHQGPLPLPLRLDGRRAPFRIRPVAGPVDARKDLRSGADRRTLHVSCAKPMRVNSTSCSVIWTPPAPLATKSRPRKFKARSTITRHTWCRLLPTSTPVSAMRKPLTSWPKR